MRFFVLALLCSCSVLSNAQLQRFQATQPKMGSPFNLVFYTKDSAGAPLLAAKAFALVDSLNHIFSDYDKTSELNNLNSTAGSDSFIQVSQPLYDIIKKSIEAANTSRGAFDITMGP